jgi:regulator of protease activity HflC (stomatin/prohibitin superfamily)
MALLGSSVLIFWVLVFIVAVASLLSFFTVSTAQVAIVTKFGKFLRAAAVKQELDADMAAFGFEIVNVLVTDIVPDAKVKSAMNDINAAQREQVAANARGETEKILVVKKAEAEAESKALQGQGIANQGKAIIEGLQGSIEHFQKVVEGASTSEVMQLVLITQYFDTIKSIGEMDKTNTLFLTHSPGAVRDLSDQLLQSMLVADRAKT